jgi:lipoprotein-anchoring transpeptidase ErfK/SrfK
VRRGGLVALFLVACAAAGLLAAALVTAAPLAEAQTGTTGTTATTTTTPPTTTAPPPTTTAPPPTTTAPLPTTTAPPPTTTAPRPKPKPKPKPRPRTTIRPGVAIAGTLVGGLTPAQARLEVQATFKRPLAIVVGKRVFKLTPQQVGAASYLGDAVKRAYRAPAGKDVSLRVRVPRANVEGWLNPLAERFYRAPVDSQLVLRGVTPFATREWPGRRLDVLAARKAIIFALWKHDRTPIRLRFEAVAPRVTRASHGDAIVIRRGSNRLYYYNGTALVRSFGVATGQSSYPTPLGAYHIVVMWRNPWWYPPASDWAKDAEPIPPGPGNPLGTRWMGISAPAVGIHGTPDAASIGYSASHGCIRMTIPEAEWLFGQVNIGTPVYIVSA